MTLLCVSAGRIFRMLSRLATPALAAIWLVSITTTARANEAADANIKAAIVYNFSSFITWKDKAPKAQNTICVSSDAEIFDELFALSQSQSKAGKPLVVELDRTAIEICDLAYLSKQDIQSGLPGLLLAQGAVTIASVKGFLQNGDDRTDPRRPPAAL